jgi:hypothetical protein
VSFADRKYFGSAGRQSLRENGVGIGDRQDHSYRTSAYGLGASVTVSWWLGAEPEFRASHGQPHHYATALGYVKAVNFRRAKRCFIERDRLLAIPY